MRAVVAALGLVVVLGACERGVDGLGASAWPVAQEQGVGSGGVSVPGASTDGARAVPASGGCVPRDDRYSGLPGCWPGGQAATVSRVVDGDTFRLTDGREIQLLGVDAPEFDDCAGRAAREHARFRVEGRDVVLHAEEGVDRDRSGRPLFYLRYTGPARVGYDLGYSLAYQGLAISYRPYAGNGRYTANVQEAVSRADGLDLGVFAGDCGQPAPAPPAVEDDGDERVLAAATPAPGPRPLPVPVPQPRPRSQPRPQPQPRPQQQPQPVLGSGCHPSYTPCVPSGPDLDCPQIGFAVRVTGPDEFRLDRDGDGRGCESYG